MLIYAPKDIAFCPRPLAQILPAKSARQFAQFPPCHSGLINRLIIFHFLLPTMPVFPLRPAVRLVHSRSTRLDSNNPIPIPSAGLSSKLTKQPVSMGVIPFTKHSTCTFEFFRHYSMLSASIQKKALSECDLCELLLTSALTLGWDGLFSGSSHFSPLTIRGPTLPKAAV